MEHHEAVIKLQETANEIRVKVEMYLLALAFTIAGLAVQSARFAADPGQWGLEIAAWVSLIASGIVGILRMERVPDVFNLAAEEHHFDGWLAEVARSPPEGAPMFPGGKPVPRAQVEAMMTEDKNNLTRRNEKLKALIARLGRVRTPLLVLGIVLLAVSRGYAGFGAAFP